MSPGAPGWWKRLSSREKGAVLLLLAAGMLGGGYRFIYRPWSLQAGRSAAERRNLEQQVAKLQDSLATLEQERQDMARQRDEIIQLAKELQDLERQMVSSQELGQLLGQLAQQGEGLSITFESMAQDVSDADERPEVKIDLAFLASYSGLTNYLRRIEQLSPYLTITDFEVLEPADGPDPAQQVKVSLRTPLRSSDSPGTVARELSKSPEAVIIERSPFNEQARPVAALNLDALRLTGITWRGKSSTAIINDEVVRIGDAVQDLRVTDILPNRVIVSDGLESHPIPLNNQ